MTTLVIKNLSEHLHARLKAQAERHHRSLSKEAVVLLEQGVLAPRIGPHDLPPLVRLKGGPLTAEEIEAAIAKGRG